MSGMAAGTRECERLPRDLRCAERAGAEPRGQCSRDEKQAQQRREKARRFPPPSGVLRVSKFDSNRPSFDRAKKILTGRNVLLRRSIGIAPRFERARVPNSKILESFALVAPSGSRLLGLSGPRDRATRIQSRGFGWGSRGQQALGEVALGIKTLQRMMVERGVCTHDEFAAKLKEIDAEDGRVDGRAPL